MAKKKNDNLAACAIAAEKMGLSYGKYMALGYRPAVFLGKEEPEELEETRVCPVCGKTIVLEGQRRNKIYCSDECSTQKNIERYLEKYHAAKQEMGDRYCAICGKVIPKNRHRGSKTCSTYCSSEYAYIRKLEYDRQNRKRKKENDHGKAENDRAV